VPGRELTDKPGRVRERDNLGAYRDSPGTYRDSPGAYQDSPGAYRDSPGSAACSLSRPIRSLSVVSSLQPRLRALYAIKAAFPSPGEFATPGESPGDLANPGSGSKGVQLLLQLPRGHASQPSAKPQLEAGSHPSPGSEPFRPARESDSDRSENRGYFEPGDAGAAGCVPTARFGDANEQGMFGRADSAATVTMPRRETQARQTLPSRVEQKRLRLQQAKERLGAAY